MILAFDPLSSFLGPMGLKGIAPCEVGLRKVMGMVPQANGQTVNNENKTPHIYMGHEILHATSLIRMRPIYVPIAPPQRTKMGPQRRLRIYVGYETISIIRYLEPLTGDVFTTRFAYCHFNEAIFPPLGGEKKNHEKDVSWSEPSLLYLDPRTKQSKIEVQKIMHMQEIANQLPDAFTDTKRVTRSYIPAINAQTRVEIPDVKSDDKFTQESKACLKRGRQVGTQNIAPPEEEIDDINKEVSINYGHSKISLDQIKTKIIDEKFCYNVAYDIMNENDDSEPTSVIECQSRHDWNKWKDAMQVELNSLNKRKVFGRIVLTPGVMKPVGLVVYENLDMRLMDVVTAYLYGSLDSMPEALSTKPKDIYFVKLQRSLYGLKQSGLGRSLNVDNDPFCPCEEDEDVLGQEVAYLSAIGALMYLVNYTRLDISFAVNLLARFSSSPTKRHWNGIKHIF
ncbi:hypothetical protein Tco_1066516 [Tanacetum coccineum]|uniref:Reverse transcriptase Ty1/copia-type domain-containing protein n=1 Tax=Tanacetum coccineum TaxID=301880 RepID=A0ABQ5HB54_9ASTR